MTSAALLVAAVVLVGAGSFAALRLGGSRWQRGNFRGSTVSLTAGPVLVAGFAALALLRTRPATAAALAAVVAGGVGAYDDLTGAPDIKGLRGHLAALARGRVTSGITKVVGLGIAGLAASWVLHRPSLNSRWLVGAVAIAGMANLANLFDLRPGRALKVLVLFVAPVVLFGTTHEVVQPAAATTGALLGALPGDLAERSMLGDAGAGAAGAAVGTLLVVALNRLGPLCGLLAVVVIATLVSERVSFSRVIDGCPPLRVLDGIGRRP